MILALAVIWIGFHILSHGDFLTARNLWNLSVQSASIAIMATGMVLIIVSRNIDLSVGSLLGLPRLHDGDGPDRLAPQDARPRPRTAVHMARRTCSSASSLGALIGGVQGFIVAYGGVPGVHRHAGRVPRLARPDLPARARRARRWPRSTTTSSCSVAGRQGSLGEWKSWALWQSRMCRHRLQPVDASSPSPALRAHAPPDRDRRSGSVPSAAQLCSAPSD